MLATYERSKKDSDDFWTLVRDETGPSPEAPDRMLARFLVTTTMSSTSERNRRRSMIRSASMREIYVKSLHAWNAWRSEETTRLNYYADKPIPAVV